MSLEAFRSEAVDEDAGRPEAGQHYKRLGPNSMSTERQPLEIQAGDGDVLAQVAICDLEAGLAEGRE